MQRKTILRCVAVLGISALTMLNASLTNAQTDILESYSGSNVQDCSAPSEIQIHANLFSCDADTLVIFQNIAGYRYLKSSDTDKKYKFAAANENLLCGFGPYGDPGEFHITFRSGGTDLGVKKLSFILYDNSDANITGVQFSNISGPLTHSTSSASGETKYECTDNTTGITSVVITCDYHVNVDASSAFELNSLYMPSGNPNPVPQAPVIGTVTQPTCILSTGSIALSGLPAAGTWTVTASPGSSAITGTGTTGNFSGLTPNTYTFTVTNAAGCTSTASENATINPPPPIPAAPTGDPTQSFCGNATVANLTVTGTAIKWYDASTGGSILPAGTPLTSGHCFASQTVGECESSLRFDVTVTINPLPIVSTGSYGPYCINSAVVTLTGTPADAYGTWSGPGVTNAGSGTASFNPAVAFSGDHVVNYSYTDANGCSNSAGTTITVLSDCPEVVCVMDISGSMKYNFDGAYGMPQNQWRISYAKTALKAFAEVLYLNFDGGTSYGLASFQRVSGGPCQAAVNYPMSILYESNYIPIIQPVIDGLNADGGTPLLAGLETAKNMFQTSDENLKKVIILLSDGAHNCPSLPNLLTNLVYTDLMAQITTKNIKVYTIAFGKSGEVDPVLLSDIASKTGGRFYDVTNPSDPEIKVVPNSATTSPADIWDAGNALHMVYSQILSSLGMIYSADPMGVISKGTTVQYNIPVSGMENKITFFISWVTSGFDYLGVKIKTSDGSELPLSHSGLKFVKRENYTVITISEDLLNQPGATGSNPWKLVLDASNITNEQEKFQYMVFSQSRKLRFHTWFDKDKYFTGDKMKIYLEVLKEDKRLTNLNKFQITGSMPKVGIGNLLAGKKVTIQQLDELKRAELTKMTSLILRQAENLKLDPSAKQKILEENLSTQLDIMTNLWLKTKHLINGGENIFNNRVKINGIQFFDNGRRGDSLAGDGLYTAVINRIKREGSYIFNISATDTINGNINVENQLQKYINVKINPRNFIKKLSPADTIVKGAKSYSLILKLTDKYGNIPSPNSLGYIQLSVDKGELIGPVQSNPDGSITQLLSIPEDVKPSAVNISMNVSGQSGTQRLIPLIPKWIKIGTLGLLIFIMGFYYRKR